MLEVLYHIEHKLPKLLEDSKRWKTLDVNYEPPRVERAWTEFEGYRVNLHMIHPCSKALFHPHPWPSAVRVLTGSYEMAVGWEGDEERVINLVSEEKKIPAVAALIILPPDSCYEMIDIGGWHYVRPIGGPSVSLIVTGKPWERTSPGKDQKHGELTDQAKIFLLQYFRGYYSAKSNTNVIAK